MTRQITKDKLLRYMRDERRYLENHLAQLSPGQMTQPEIYRNRTIKDMLAFLVGWEKLAMTWIEISFQGEKPELPAPGMSWQYKDLRVLDQRLIDEYVDLSLDEMMDEFHASYQTIRDKVESIPEQAFTDLERFSREEGGPLGRLVAANTAWHYRHVKTQILEWMRKIKQEDTHANHHTRLERT